MAMGALMVDIPPINDANTPTKTPNSANVPVVGARTLIGVPIQLVEIRPEAPGKFHKKVDLFIFKNKDGELRGFFNSILRRWNLQPGDTITLQLVTGSNGTKHYEPTNINGKQQPNAKQTQRGLDKDTVIKLAAESQNELAFMNKIAPLLPGTKYENLPVAERLETFKRMYAKYKPTSQPSTTKT
jgi:hypothetical protein